RIIGAPRPFRSRDGWRAGRRDGTEGRPLRQDPAAGDRRQALHPPRPGAGAVVVARRRPLAGAARGAAARTRGGAAGAAPAVALGRHPARSQLPGRRRDVPAAAARRHRLLPRSPAPAAGAAQPRHRAQRPGQGGELAGARRRPPGDRRFPARRRRAAPGALAAAARARGPAPPAQAQAHVLPGGAHAGGAPAAAAHVLVPRCLVRHRKAGVPGGDPPAAALARQRGQGAPAMTALAGKTVFITGASRGIGRAIALRLARDGAYVAIAAKSAVANPKLPGTIHSVAAEVEVAGGRGLALKCDIREEAQVQAAVDATVAAFGGIDVLVNNASAIWLRGALDTPMKRFDLMHGVNARGTFLCSQA